MPVDGPDIDTDTSRPADDDDAGPPDPDRVERRRHVAAAPATLWRVLADRDTRRHVLGGDLDVDLVEGAEGTWRPADGAAQPVRVHRVDEHRRLAFDWGAGEDASTVDIRLQPVRIGTAVRVVETRRGSVTAPRLRAGDTLCLAA